MTEQLTQEIKQTYTKAHQCEISEDWGSREVLPAHRQKTIILNKVSGTGSLEVVQKQSWKLQDNGTMPSLL